MNEQQFKEQVIPLNSRLLKIALRFNYDIDWAKDIVQDVYLTLWKRRDKLNEVKSIEAYAVQSIRNTCIDRLKKQRVMSIDEVPIQIKDEDSQVEVQGEKAELVQKIRTLIPQLPYMQQMAITLCDLEQMNTNEAAEALEVKEGTLRANLSRARKKIVDKLQKWSNFEAAPKSQAYVK
jgi:RNA polymerase sigma-70 factor (ECF subfamily)